VPVQSGKAVAHAAPLVLLGPQHAHPQVGRVLRELGARHVAVITAGWQERELDTGVLPELGVPHTNLMLHARADEVFASDRELAAAYKARQTRLKVMQDFYRVRLAHLNDAVHAISLRQADAELHAAEDAASLALVRMLDREHLARCRDMHAEFAKRFPGERVASQRRAIETELADANAVVIAGGHVAVLLNRMRMFDVAALWRDRPVVAWSAGAMALCEQVVLFHHDPPAGPPVTEVLDAGLGLARGLVALPSPRTRLHLEDRDQVAGLARRFSGMACIAMDHHARIELDDGRVMRGAGNHRLTEDGSVDRSWPP
jgi:hypothetical protein